MCPTCGGHAVELAFPTTTAYQRCAFGHVFPADTDAEAECPADCTYVGGHFHHRTGWVRDHRGWWHDPKTGMTLPEANAAARANTRLSSTRKDGGR